MTAPPDPDRLMLIRAADDLAEAERKAAIAWLAARGARIEGLVDTDVAAALDVASYAVIEAVADVRKALEARLEGGKDADPS